MQAEPGIKNVFALPQRPLWLLAAAKRLNTGLGQLRMSRPAYQGLWQMAPCHLLGLSKHTDRLHRGLG